MFINKNYYIIKATCDNGKHTYYKIGESKNINRPNKLIEKYREKRANDATLLAFEELPHGKEKRLNDKVIHSKIDGTILKPADRIYIEHFLDSDGSTEFFETVSPMTDEEVVNYIKTLVANIKKKDYKAKNIENYALEYEEDKYHLVNSNVISKIFKHFPITKKLVHKSFNNNILLIGQFDFDFVGTFAMINNVYIWHDSKENKHVYTYSEVNSEINYIENLEELLDMDIKFDLIIANPPYGKVGANITKNIIENIDFEEYINLLPANDYSRNDDKDLYKYVDLDTMKPLNSAFDDAAVTTHMAKISRRPHHYITFDKFEIENYIDSSLTKYFYENRARGHYAIDAGITWLVFAENNDMHKTIILDHRCIPHKHLAYSKATDEYKWNVLESIDNAYLSTNTKVLSTPGKMNKYVVKLNTAIEKQNMVSFIYSPEGFRFISKLFNALNTDSTLELAKWLPKVDWTRSWTVEEILRDYGYTEEEIEEVMSDLVNFKGMED